MKNLKQLTKIWRRWQNSNFSAFSKETFFDKKKEFLIFSSAIYDRRLKFGRWFHGPMSLQYVIYLVCPSVYRPSFKWQRFLLFCKGFVILWLLHNNISFLKSAFYLTVCLWIMFVLRYLWMLSSLFMFNYFGLKR